MEKCFSKPQGFSLLSYFFLPQLQRRCTSVQPLQSSTSLCLFYKGGIPHLSKDIADSDRGKQRERQGEASRQIILI